MFVPEKTTRSDCISSPAALISPACKVKAMHPIMSPAARREKTDFFPLKTDIVTLLENGMREIRVIVNFIRNILVQIFLR
jgi:hypothetical protein